jgi:hypothetical protein
MTAPQANRGQGSFAAAPAQAASRRGRPSKRPKVTYTCEVCGITKTVYDHPKRRYRFCSQNCNLINARSQRKKDPLAKTKARQRISKYGKQKRFNNHKLSANNMLMRGKCALHPIYNNGMELQVTLNNLPMFAWDHIDRTNKTASVARLKQRTADLVQTEIDKCQLVCHNCHAMKSKQHNDHIPVDKTNQTSLTLF